MASKKVNLTISLKDGVSAGLRKIGGGLRATGVAFKKMAIAGVAATTAIIAGLAAVTKAYAEQESVNNKMKATFDAAGESGTKAVAVWGAWATQIQRATTLGDEEIISLITLGKTMGVTNDKLAEATKGAIGLSKAFGIDMTSAMKMVVLAQNGEYEMLQRYIPELRKATTEAEKHAVVQKAMVAGFKVAEAELDTMAGQWVALKGVVGDAMQELGWVLSEDGGFAGKIEQIKDAIITLTEDGSITRWADQTSTAIEGVGKVVGPVIDHFTRLIRKYNDLGRFVGAFAESLKSGSGFKEAIKDANDYVEATNNNIEAQKKLAAETERVNKLVADKEKAQKTEDERWDKMLSEQRDLDVQSGLTSGWSPGAGKGGGAADTAVSPVVKAVKSSGGGGASDAAGFAEMAKKMMDAGTSSHLALRATTQAAELEADGRRRGIEGIGKMAEEMLRAGESIAVVRHDLEKVMQAGEAGADATKKKDTTADLIAESNELARQQLAITTERLGGVKP